MDRALLEGTGIPTLRQCLLLVAENALVESKAKASALSNTVSSLEDGKKVSIQQTERLEKEVADLKKLARENHKATVKRIESQSQGE